MRGIRNRAVRKMMAKLKEMGAIDHLTGIIAGAEHEVLTAAKRLEDATDQDVIGEVPAVEMRRDSLEAMIDAMAGGSFDDLWLENVAPELLDTTDGVEGISAPTPTSGRRRSPAGRRRTEKAAPRAPTERSPTTTFGTSGAWTSRRSRIALSSSTEERRPNDCSQRTSAPPVRSSTTPQTSWRATRMSETDSEPKDKTDVYRERNLNALLALRALSLLDQHNLAYVPMGYWHDTDDVNGDEWAVVWADLPDEGQAGWHVPTEMVPDWLPERDPEYDGYSTPEKNRRVALAAGVDPDAAGVREP
ncbi:hypothetical protein [Halobaculum halobium]|uniref:Uncharacterized protein n=1 Tax=Halobaculum halobium TaxID=3032281 RepID=A0ABD5TFW0_9EURY|nr:hypothetical protein [Halobaculum sp. SYNS20]